MKKAVLGLFSFGALCLLAYYSSYLYSDRYAKENGYLPELNAEQPENIPTPEPDREEISKEQPDETAEEGKPDKGEGESVGTKGQPDTLEVTEDPLLETALPPGAVEADILSGGQEEVEYSYYLVEEFGYVNIYNADQETIYEYTEISIGDLPQELQEEICTGKGVLSEQELYDFLENYSS